MKKTLLSLVYFLFRLKLRLTTRKRATANIQYELRQYLSLAEQFGEEGGKKRARIPKLFGIDEDMRDWSFFMILQHNILVHRVYRSAMESLSKGIQWELSPDSVSKALVTPSHDAGPEQLDLFMELVEDYLKLASTIEFSKDMTVDHSLLGPMTMPMGHALFGTHLKVHRRQAERLLSIIKNA